MSKLEIIYKDPRDLKPYENNARINDHAVDDVATSIEQFGFQQPIVVDPDFVIIAGHTRWKAATKLGLTEVPVTIAAGLTAAQAAAYRLADNKVAEKAKWNKAQLKAEIDLLKSLEFDLSNIGFSEVELRALTVDSIVNAINAEAEYIEQDDRLRGLRSKKDGAVIELKADALTQINPLDGWTESMVRRYHLRHNLPKNPIAIEGETGVGCRYCGGGMRFPDNVVRLLRKKDPADWRHLMTELGHARIVLAIKYEAPLDVIDEALEQLGGLDAVIDKMPHVFDFLQYPPRSIDGYDKG